MYLSFLQVLHVPKPYNNSISACACDVLHYLHASKEVCTATYCNWKALFGRIPLIPGRNNDPRRQACAWEGLMRQGCLDWLELHPELHHMMSVATSSTEGTKSWCLGQHPIVPPRTCIQKMRAVASMAASRITKGITLEFNISHLPGMLCWCWLSAGVAKGGLDLRAIVRREVL